VGRLRVADDPSNHLEVASREPDFLVGREDRDHLQIVGVVDVELLPFDIDEVQVARDTLAFGGGRENFNCALHVFDLEVFHASAPIASVLVIVLNIVLSFVFGLKSATIVIDGDLMDRSHKKRAADTDSPGREPNEFEPHEFDDLPAERPMNSGDVWGAPDATNTLGAKRFKRELRFQAWQYLERHNPEMPFPKWVADYLRDVATTIAGDIGPRGSLSPASAHAALGIIGEKWPEHHPESVFSIINAWLDPDRLGGPLVDGRKAGAVRYIKQYMCNDPNILAETVIEWYRKGQKAHKHHSCEPSSREGEILKNFDASMPTRIVISQPRK